MAIGRSERREGMRVNRKVELPVPSEKRKGIGDRNKKYTVKSDKKRSRTEKISLKSERSPK